MFRAIRAITIAKIILEMKEYQKKSANQMPFVAFEHSIQPSNTCF